MNKPNHLNLGARVPQVSFRTRSENDWLDVNSSEIFDGKTVVDEIYCLSVNGTFVMNAWAKDQRVEDEVQMLPDGNGAFSSGMGMLVDKSDLGFGPRSWRYSMLVRDGVIEEMFTEDFATPGDPFEVSDAMTMLEAMGDPAAQSA